MALHIIAADLRDAPRNASGPRCLCCNRPAAWDLEDDADEWREITLGGFLSLSFCGLCHECPLVGPCRVSEAGIERARRNREVED